MKVTKMTKKKRGNKKQINRTKTKTKEKKNNKVKKSLTKTTKKNKNEGIKNEN